MSRTIRRKGWTYWESNQREAVENNPLFGNRGWINSSMPESYKYAINGVYDIKDVASFIHRDLKKGWRYDEYMNWIDSSTMRPKQRAALSKVLRGEEYMFDERSELKRCRGIAEWIE